MARCGCAGASCSCVVKGTGGVTVTGSGSAANPYEVSSEINFQVTDTATVDLTMSGDGSAANPYQLSAEALLSLNELTDVDTSGAVTGYVLARQVDGTYMLVPPSTAPAGSIAIGNGLSGTGAAGAPLAVKLAASSGLLLDANGLSVQGAGAWTAYTPVWTATTTNPSLGNGSLTGRYTRIGKLVFFFAQLVFGSTTTRGVGSYGLSLPVGQFAPSYQSIVHADISNGNPVEFNSRGRLNGNKVYPMQYGPNSAMDMLWFGSNSPASMPAGSFARVQGFYEAA